MGTPAGFVQGGFVSLAVAQGQQGSEFYAASSAVRYAASGGVPVPNLDQSSIKAGSLEGAGSPVNVVTPTAIGEQYLDKNSMPPAIWVSNGLTSANWQRVK